MNILSLSLSHPHTGPQPHTHTHTHTHVHTYAYTHNNNILTEEYSHRAPHRILYLCLLHAKLAKLPSEATCYHPLSTLARLCFNIWISRLSFSFSSCRLSFCSPSTSTIKCSTTGGKITKALPANEHQKHKQDSDSLNNLFQHSKTAPFHTSLEDLFKPRG